MGLFRLTSEEGAEVRANLAAFAVWPVNWRARWPHTMPVRSEEESDPALRRGFRRREGHLQTVE